MLLLYGAELMPKLWNQAGRMHIGLIFLPGLEQWVVLRWEDL